MEKYMRTSRNPSEASRRRFSTGVSLSARASLSAAGEEGATTSASFNLAPYPAASTAAMTASGAAVPSTPIEFVSRLTAQDVTPGTFRTALSTLALHAVQLMPVTLYCSTMRAS